MQERFEKQVLEYEAADRASLPPRGAILFAGDSQFYRWKTIHEDLPGYTLINRGIDSFQLEHLIQYADRLVLPYDPRLIVLHVGGNDVHNGKTPEQRARGLQDTGRQGAHPPAESADHILEHHAGSRTLG